MRQDLRRTEKKRVKSQRLRVRDIREKRFDASTSGKYLSQTSLPGQLHVPGEMVEEVVCASSLPEDVNMLVIIDLNGVLVHGLSVANEKVWSSTDRPDARDLVR